MDGIANKCSKLFYSGFVVFLAISDVSSFVCGCLVIHWLAQYSTFYPFVIYAPAILLLIITLASLGIEWLGFKGIQLQKHGLILIFCVYTLLKSVSYLLITGWAIVQLDSSRASISDRMAISLDKYIKKSYDKEDWHELQKNFRCCGIKGISDYSSLGHIPLSCCNTTVVDEEELCHGHFYDSGCMEAVYEHSKYQYQFFIFVLLLATIAQVVGMFAFLLLFARIVNQKPKATAPEQMALRAR